MTRNHSVVSGNICCVKQYGCEIACLSYVFCIESHPHGGTQNLLILRIFLVEFREFFQRFVVSFQFFQAIDNLQLHRKIVGLDEVGMPVGAQRIFVVAKQPVA